MLISNNRSSRFSDLRAGQRRGFALVFVLALTVLLSLLVAHFLSMSVAGRKISNAQVNHYRADLIARSSIQTLVGVIRSELEKGSQLTPAENGKFIYTPTSRPFQFLTRNLSTNQPAILKMSQEGVSFSNRPDLPSDPSFSPTAIRVLTDQPDMKGRAVNMEAWSKSQLQFGDTIGNQVPHWILLGRNGLLDPAQLPPLSKLSDSQSINPDFAIGRYAYAVYDLGGLLNINYAGAPTIADAAFKAKRGGISQVDLSVIPGLSHGAQVANWRLRKTGTQLDLLKSRLFEEVNAKDQIREGDRGFLSRKELIQYSKQFPERMGPEALRFLTHYHETLDAPSFIPNPKRPRATTESTAYGLDDQINPNLFTAKDAQGRLVVQRRFPLSRLSILEKGSDTILIEKYFGLKKTDKPYTWTYNHGDPAKILRLSDIAALRREPDFFETLKAAIQVGSLGKNLTPTASYYLINDADTPHTYTDNQIIEIGLNIIDQWDEDSYPTRIYFDNDILNRGEFYGTENLPGIYRLIDIPYQNGTGAGTPVGLWEQPELWNLHQPDSAASTKAPLTLRFVGKGSVYCYMFNLNDGSIPPVNGVSTITLTNTGENIGVEFSPSINQSCREPAVLTRLNSTAYGDNLPPGTTYSFVGLHVGTTLSPNTDFTTGYNLIRNIFDPHIDFELQYQVQGTWVTYNRMDKVSRIGGGYLLPTNGTYPHSYFIFRTRSDPRTARFGNMIQDNFVAALPGVSTVRPNKTVGSFCWDPTMQVGPIPVPGWSFGAPPWPGYLGAFYPGELSENKQSSSTRYLDPDGVLRRADGAYVDGASNAGYPQIAGNFDSRPVILNRPFRSVADLGYVFRATPWKHLDFFTIESADSALLDFFCIQEPAADAIVSNQISLNTPYTEILQARLQGAIKKENDLNEVISKKQAEEISKKISAAINDPQTGPFQNRSELVTQFAAQVNYDNTTDNIIKTRREAAVRALAEGSDTRTWNLMIDLVAQSGRYASTAKKLSEFNVTSQARYWYYISIDRFTGKILDQKWEKVSD